MSQPRARLGVLTLGALGVVFGDIGTSPLYALQTVFDIDHNAVSPTRGDVYGVISLVFWSITIIVSVKYVGFVLRADNDGEGGILSLAHLTRSKVREDGKRFKLVMVLGVIGASLFYGDSLITPAISVLSAVEGVNVAAPSLGHIILPAGALIIVALFAIQRRGTEFVGKFFGPIMVLWFLTLAVMGLPRVIAHPGILAALLPEHAILFFVDRPFVAFIAMGAVVLAITGAEALYADMGHFGRRPIRLAWFALVFPCLTLNYLGQGQLVLSDPKAASSPFFTLAPDWARIPLVVLATIATVIASQAVISGAFSVSRQAERLGYLPRLTVRHTSRHESGQIYVPSVNWLLFIGVLILMLTFRSSARLATAYGLAVTGTLLLTTTLFLVYAQAALGWSRGRIIAAAVGFGTLEVIFFAANLTKVIHGGWLPLLIAIVVGTIMFTWRRGVELITPRREKLEGPLQEFIETVNERDDVDRVPGTAIFMHPGNRTVPLAMRENVAFNHVLHEEAIIVSAVAESRPVVPDEERVEIDHLGDEYDHITHVTLRFGFDEDQDVPTALALAREKGLVVDLDEALYFLSRMTVHASDRPGMSRWRKRMVVAMAHNAANPTEYFHLPVARTVLMGAQVMF